MSGNTVIGQKQVENHELAAMQRDISDMKSLMGRMVDALAKITVIEERQHAMAQATNKVLDRMDAIATRQHEQDLAHATTASTIGKVEAIERAFRELYVDSERHKARFDTIVWTVRALWGVVGGGGLVWLIQAIAHNPLVK